ncbi:MAG: Pr6Pr family membrane protein [Bacteroidetes bacterium]|nr:Pr6Pr family membrane protein [Bacteroidota bacterium]
MSIALLGWFALIIQFYINITSGVANITELVTRYFSFFTILTNLLVAICCTCIVFIPQKRLGIFFLKPQTLTAITVYILIVGIIYNIILRFLWQPAGIQKLVDELLHSVIPVLFLLYWWFAVNKRDLKWKQILPWLIYPLVYLIYILIRGSYSGFYPYPFVNVKEHGMVSVIQNSIGITLAFIFVGIILIAAGKWQYAIKYKKP